MIKAEIVADSKNEYGNRLTTFVITFPRIILAEFNTHRMLSKNTASSRAIPFAKLVKMVEENPFIPIAWQKDHKGMQGTEYFTDAPMIKALELEWLIARDTAVDQAILLSDYGVTKQICNRLLEPFMWCTMIVSGTEWENFFHLRCPRYEIKSYHNDNLISSCHYRSKKDFIANESVSAVGIDWLKQNKGQAEIHMMALAEAMWDAYNESTPKQLKAGEWHIPFEDRIDRDAVSVLTIERDVMAHLHWSEVSGNKLDELLVMNKVKISTVMAARTSYTVVGEDQKPMSYAKMIELHDKLKNADPIHASPFEHCGRAQGGSAMFPKMDIKWSGNFLGFDQYRKMIPGENKI